MPCRGSSTRINLKPRKVRGTLDGNRSNRIEEWRDPEPPADDDPDVPTAGPVTPEAGHSTRWPLAVKAFAGLNNWINLNYPERKSP
jgi:hypothetical protein